MVTDAFQINNGLASATRLPAWRRLDSRISAAELALDKPGARFFDGWFSQAVVTYTLSGAVAGLLGAFCWFQFRSRPARPPLDGAE